MLAVAAVLAGLLVLIIGTGPAEATFPGTNGKIAFVKGATSTNEYGDIYSVGAGGAGIQKLTSGSVSTGPAYSASGAKIAFAKRVNGATEVFTMNADGSNQTRLTTNPSSDDFPSFSPAGNKIAFRSTRDGNGVNESPDPDGEIWVINANGDSPTRLTNNNASDGDPNWSPDGSKIVFISRRISPNNPEIYIMNANGTGQTRLTTNANDDFTPEFSPSGQRIVFWSNRDGDAEIFTMSINGTNLQKLTNNTILDYTPNYSPDGKKIAFSRATGATVREQQIYTMNANGTGVSKVTNDTLGDTYPTWQPR